MQRWFFTLVTLFFFAQCQKVSNSYIVKYDSDGIYIQKVISHFSLLLLKNIVDKSYYWTHMMPIFIVRMRHPVYL